MQKGLHKEIGENFKYQMKRGVHQQLKYRKNHGAKTTLIEYTPEGLNVSIKPSDDIFEGQKIRRRNSFNKGKFLTNLKFSYSFSFKSILW